MASQAATRPSAPTLLPRGFRFQPMPTTGGDSLLSAGPSSSLVCLASGCVCLSVCLCMYLYMSLYLCLSLYYLYFPFLSLWHYGTSNPEHRATSAMGLSRWR